MSIFNLSRFPLSLVCTAIVASTTLSTASAASSFEDEALSLIVKYDDLNLASERDAAKLYQRLQAASRNVCRTLRSRDLSSAQRYKDCYARALGDAVYAVNERTLTALHQQPAERTVRAGRYTKARST